MADNLFDLSGKVALITGGNGGIGLGIATGLANAGAAVIIAARDAEKNQRAVESLKRIGARAAALAVDVQDEASIKTMVGQAAQTFGSIGILVNNAGISVAKAPEKYSLEEWQRVININLTGVFLCSREVHPHLRAAGGGKIINIGSMTSIFGHPRVASYSSSKGAVVQLSKSLALAWAKDNIQVNAILPGWINTDLTAGIKQLPDYYSSITARIPQNRWGEPGDLAGTAVFLASRASDYVTGIALPVDGGYSCM
ncbi:MAG: glucose 1-dehydrogenase [Desulfobacteraceae bacterium]|nr:MAG: glucose 1-dehydrogenase [Desulfobacteraceae bacterium]